MVKECRKMEDGDNVTTISDFCAVHISITFNNTTADNILRHVVLVYFSILLAVQFSINNIHYIQIL